MALLDQSVLFLCLNPWLDLPLMIEGTMASGIMFAARSELCIVIWMGFVKLLRSISILFFIIIFFLGYLGFNVKKFVKGALLS